MDEFQLYKLAHLEVYSITEVAKMEIVGDPNGSNLNRFSLANMKGHKLFQDGQALTEEELMEILKSSLGSKSLDDMDRLLTKDKMNDKDVIDQCRQFGKTQEDEDAAALEQLKNGMTAEVKIVFNAMFMFYTKNVILASGASGAGETSGWRNDNSRSFGFPQSQKGKGRRRENEKGD